jgi:DNA helicase-2/ATP-dependent DNA helicase PcrA
VACFLKVAVNPNDELSFKRIVRLLPGVGGATADKLWRTFHPVLVGGSKLTEVSPGVPKKAAGDWKQVAATLNQLRAMPPPLKASKMIELVTEGYYEGHLKAKYPNARARVEDLRQLGSFGQQFEAVEEFLSQLALLTNLEADDAALISTNEQEYVRLSTVHQAKGQEWAAVFVIGLCDGMFPLARTLDSLDGEEEERRLFYVAVTRAKDELFMLYPLFRMSGGDAGGFQRPSRFIAELPKQHYQELALRYQSRGW